MDSMHGVSPDEITSRNSICLNLRRLEPGYTLYLLLPCSFAPKLSQKDVATIPHTN